MNAALNAHLQKQAAKSVASARLGRPESCEACGARGSSGSIRPSVVWHHHDYAKPLDVIPLCISCHGKVHAGSITEPRTGRVYPRPSGLMSTKAIPITLRLPPRLLRAVEGLATGRTRTRNEQLVHMLEGARNIDLERLPVPEADEDAKAYRERLQRIADGGQ